MTRFQIIAIRLLLLAVVLAAWETLPRNGVVNPMLLPPLSDVLKTLVQLLGRAQVHEAILVTAAEVIVAFVIAVPLGAAIGVLLAESDYVGQIFKPLMFYVYVVDHRRLDHIHRTIRAVWIPASEVHRKNRNQREGRCGRHRTGARHRTPRRC